MICSWGEGATVGALLGPTCRWEGQQWERGYDLHVGGQGSCARRGEGSHGRGEMWEESRKGEDSDHHR